jgi:hypothetical protein
MKRYRKRTFKRKRIFKRKIKRRIRKLRAYAKPDGMHKAKFTALINVERGASSTQTQLYINWNTNLDGTGTDITACPDYATEAALWN